MRRLFSNTLYFSILFFSILLIDILVKTNIEEIYYRFITKTLVMTSLIIYYFINQKEVMKKRFTYMSLALFSFFIGDVFLLLYENSTLYIIGMLFFVLGKLFYAFRFSNQKDFKLSSLLPFIIPCFIFLVVLMNLIYDNLGNFFIPVMIYLFTCLIVTMFSFLRKDEVNFNSYILVLVGIAFSILSDTITVLQGFYMPDMAYHKVTIMLFYGLSQYFIVIGVVRENNTLIFDK